jgi:hypothetical protein
MDSGATTHVTSDLNNLSTSTIYIGSDEVHIGNGSCLLITHFGSSCISTTTKPIFLTNILLVSAITKNLLSVSQLLKDNDVIIEFTQSSCFVKDRSTHRTLLHGTLVNGLYKLDFSIHKHATLHVDHLLASLWHSRLAPLFPSYYKSIEQGK